MKVSRNFTFFAINRRERACASFVLQLSCRPPADASAPAGLAARVRAPGNRSSAASAGTSAKGGRCQVPATLPRSGVDNKRQSHRRSSLPSPLFSPDCRVGLRRSGSLLIADASGPSALSARRVSRRSLGTKRQRQLGRRRHPVRSGDDASIGRHVRRSAAAAWASATKRRNALVGSDFNLELTPTFSEARPA